MSEEEWERREREARRSVRQGRILDIITLALIAAAILCLLYIVLAP